MYSVYYICDRCLAAVCSFYNSIIYIYNSVALVLLYYLYFLVLLCFLFDLFYHILMFITTVVCIFVISGHFYIPWSCMCPFVDYLTVNEECMNEWMDEACMQARG